MERIYNLIFNITLPDKTPDFCLGFYNSKKTSKQQFLILYQNKTGIFCSTSNCLINGFSGSGLCTAASCWQPARSHGFLPPKSHLHQECPSPPQAEPSMGKTLSRHQSWVCPSDHCLATAPEIQVLFWQGGEISMKTRPGYGLKVKAEAFLPVQKCQVPREGKAIADGSFCGVPSSPTVRHWLYSQICESLGMLQAKILPLWCISSIFFSRALKPRSFLINSEQQSTRGEFSLSILSLPNKWNSQKKHHRAQ